MKANMMNKTGCDDDVAMRSAQKRKAIFRVFMSTNGQAQWPRVMANLANY